MAERPDKWCKQSLIDWGVDTTHEMGRFPQSREVPATSARKYFGTFSRYIDQVKVAYALKYGALPEIELVGSSGAIETPRAPSPEVDDRPPTDLRDDVVVVLPDTHFPFHDPEAVEVAMRIVEHYRPGRVVHLGDLLDCGPFSSHGGNTIDEVRSYDFVEMEIKPARQMIKRGLKTCGHWVQSDGNHEYRVQRSCIKHGIPGVELYNATQPEKLLFEGIPEARFTHIPYIKSVKDSSHGYWITPNLLAVHGWSFSQNAAATHLRYAKSVSVVYGHCHRVDLAMERCPMTGRIIQAFCPGTLSLLQPIYFTDGRPTSWVQGVSVIFISENNPEDWTQYQIQIHNGRAILPDGTAITAS